MCSIVLLVGRRLFGGQGLADLNVGLAERPGSAMTTVNAAPMLGAQASFRIGRFAD
jgi:hypothetical protein